MSSDNFSFEAYNKELHYEVNASDAHAFTIYYKLFRDGVQRGNERTMANKSKIVIEAQLDAEYRLDLRLRDALGKERLKSYTHAKSANKHSLELDRLVFNHNGNKLLKVTDNAAGSGHNGSFKHKTTANQYKYNQNGQMTQDLNRDIQSISYNHQQLPVEMTFSSGHALKKVSYDYNDQGQRIRKVKTKADNSTEAFRYVRDASGALIGELDESTGKLSYSTIYGAGDVIGMEEYVADGSGTDYYYLKDHLGNTRVTLKDVRHHFYEDFEEGDHWVFEKSSANSHPKAHEIITENGNKVHVLRNNSGTSVLYKRLKVKPKTSYKISYRVKINKASEAYNGLYYFYWNSSNQHGTYNYLRANLSLIGQWQKVEKTMTTPETGAAIGYGRVFDGSSMELALRIYSGSVTNSEIMLDDIVVTELGTAHSVQATNSYYPYGMKINRPGQIVQGSNNINKIKVQGKERDQETGYDNFGARLNDPVLARFLQVDPMAEKLPHLNPYNSMSNNPMTMIDPDGKYSINVHYYITRQALTEIGFQMYGSSRSDAFVNTAAHMASVYADHPSSAVMFFQNKASLVHHSYRNNVDYSATARSQEDDPSQVVRHAMRATGEAISAHDAMMRGRRFGWDHIFKASEYEISGDPNSEFMRNFGPGLHALQDSYAHEGASMEEHVSWSNPISSGKMLSNDSFGKTDKALNVTKTAAAVVQAMKGNFSGIQKMINSGEVLNLSGMSAVQRKKLYAKLKKAGFEIEQDGEKIE